MIEQIWLWLAEPYMLLPFMQQALVMGMLVAIPAGALSCLLVLKGWSLMGDAVSHSVLPGIVIAWLLGLPMLLGAFAAGMASSVMTGFIVSHSRLKEDTVMGIVFSGLFALGVALFTKIDTGLHLDHVLFGDMLGVSWEDTLFTACLTIPALIYLLVRQRDLMVFAFDPQHAQIVGIPANSLHYTLLAILSIVIVASIKAVGIILVIAVLIAPGTIAYLLASRFSSMLLIAMTVSLLSTVFGLTLSFYINSAPASTIVVLLTLIFCVAFIASPKHGLVSQSLRQRRIAKQIREEIEQSAASQPTSATR